MLRGEQRNGRVVHTLFGHNKHSMRTGNCKVQQLVGDVQNEQPI